MKNIKIQFYNSNTIINENGDIWGCPHNLAWAEKQQYLAHVPTWVHIQIIDGASVRR